MEKNVRGKKSHSFVSDRVDFLGSQALLNHNLNTLFSWSLSRISSEDVNVVIVLFLPKPGNCLSY